jgi:hypothetical protein
MDISKRTLTTTEESVLKNDLLDVQDWVTKAIDGKASKCKKRMIAEWLPKLYADDSVDSIPADEDEVIAMIVARDDYKNRVVRNQGYPEGDPSTDWELSELQKYCDDNSVDYEDGTNLDEDGNAIAANSKAELVELIEAE